MRLRVERTGDHHVDLATEQVADRRRRALVGHIQDIQPGHHLHALAGHVQRRAQRADRHRVLARMRPDLFDEGGHVLSGEVLARHQHAGHPGQHADGCEVADRVEGQLAVQRGVDRKAREGDQQRVAVGRALGDVVGGDVTAGAGTVLDHDGAPERLAHVLADVAGHSVRGAAGRCADHQLDGRGLGGDGQAERAGDERAARQEAVKSGQGFVSGGCRDGRRPPYPCARERRKP